MSFYQSYPYGPMSYPASSGYRFTGNNNNYSAMVEPPFPSGAPITPLTPTGPANFINYPQGAEASAYIQDYLTNVNARGGYTDYILNYNKGKLAHVHMTFNSGGGAPSQSRVFTGIIEAAARDHIILSDVKNGHRYVLLMVYLDYVEFPEEINYYYPGTNVLNVVDETILETYPDIVPIYEYQKLRKERFLKYMEVATAELQAEINAMSGNGSQIQPY